MGTSRLRWFPSTPRWPLVVSGLEPREATSLGPDHPLGISEDDELLGLEGIPFVDAPLFDHWQLSIQNSTWKPAA